MGTEGEGVCQVMDNFISQYTIVERMVHGHKYTLVYQLYIHRI